MSNSIPVSDSIFYAGIANAFTRDCFWAKSEKTALNYTFKEKVCDMNTGKN